MLTAKESQIQHLFSLCMVPCQHIDGRVVTVANQDVFIAMTNSYRSNHTPFMFFQKSEVHDITERGDLACKFEAPRFCVHDLSFAGGINPKEKALRHVKRSADCNSLLSRN